MTRYQAVRGTFDVLPDRMSEWYQLEKTARTLAIRFGFREIRTPLFERAELYTKGMGVMAGLIEKELWTFQDKFGQKLALRADMTAGIVRAYQQHRLSDGPAPQKLFYLAPVFLLGKEGEEGSRQSHQFGFEALGSESPALDAEVIALASTFCNEIGLKGHTIRLNSMGCDESRPLYQQKLKEYFGAHSDQLCGTCKRKYKTHPEWVLSCSEDGCRSLSQVAPTIYGLLTNGSKEHFNRLKEHLQAMELPFELDPRIVRDSEYYKRTVFDICYEGQSLGFGGRYDNLAERLGGKATPGVGFALSLETVLDLLGRQEEEEEDRPIPLTFFFQAEGPESAKLLVPLLHQIRTEGVAAEFDYQAEYARPQKPPSGCRYLLYLDESNAFRGHAVLTHIETGKDEKIAISRLGQKIRQLAGVSSPSSDERPSSGSRKKLRRGRKRSEEEKSVRAEAEPKQAASTNDSRSSESEERESAGESRSRSRSKDSRREPRKAKDDSDSPAKEREPRESRKRPAAEKDRRPAEGDTGSGTKRGRSKPAREEASDDGKAMVPALVLGGAAPKASSAASSPAKKRAEKSPKPVEAAPVPDLNWSILPGQDSKSSGGGNGSSKSSKKKESR